VGDGWWVEGGDGGREEGKIWGEKMDVLHRSKVGFPQIFFFFFLLFFFKKGTDFAWCHVSEDGLWSPE
jgi:hypothetical protein